MLAKIYCVVIVFACSILVCAEKSSALDIMEEHLTRPPANIQVTASRLDLKKEITQADTQYIKGMIRYHSCVSRLWSVTDKIATAANMLATVGTVAAIGADFYYRQHNMEEIGNSSYNSASFAFAISAFGTSMLQLIASRMHARSKELQKSLNLSLASENPLEMFRKLEHEDVKKHKKKKKKSKKCKAIAPGEGETALDIERKRKQENEYMKKMIERHSFVANTCRTSYDFSELSNAFITVGTGVTTGVDFYYRENNLTGSSKNSAYNHAALVLSTLLLSTKVIQFISLKAYTRSERIHVHLNKALESADAMEKFRQLEDISESDEQDEEEQLPLPDKTSQKEKKKNAEYLPPVITSEIKFTDHVVDMPPTPAVTPVRALAEVKQGQSKTGSGSARSITSASTSQIDLDYL